MSKIKLMFMLSCTAQSLQFSAKKVIITAGAYVNDIIKSLNFRIKLCIWEMVFMYFTMDATLDPLVQVIANKYKEFKKVIFTP